MPPLSGLRVIDLTRVVAGPFCTMMLGDMGAEVLKIEEPQHGDDSRAWAPYIHGWGSFYLALNRSKKSALFRLLVFRDQRLIVYRFGVPKGNGAFVAGSATSARKRGCFQTDASSSRVRMSWM